MICDPEADGGTNETHMSWECVPMCGMLCGATFKCVMCLSPLYAQNLQEWKNWKSSSLCLLFGLLYRYCVIRG